MLEPAGQEANLPTRSKFVYFGFGFLGWYVIHTVVWAVLFRLGGSGAEQDMIGSIIQLFVAWPLLIVGNGVGITLMVRNKNLKLIGLGALSALGLNFAVSMILGLFLNAFCFAPPYFPLG